MDSFESFYIWIKSIKTTDKLGSDINKMRTPWKWHPYLKVAAMTIIYPLQKTIIQSIAPLSKHRCMNFLNILINTTNTGLR